MAETKDFIDAGLEPEFIGRVPVRVVASFAAVLRASSRLTSKAIRSLDAEDLYKILALAEDSVLQQFQSPGLFRRPAMLKQLQWLFGYAKSWLLRKDFKGYGIELKASAACHWSLVGQLLATCWQAQTDALRRVAELAVEEKTGARALVTVMEKAGRRQHCCANASCPFTNLPWAFLSCWLQCALLLVLHIDTLAVV